MGRSYSGQRLANPILHYGILALIFGVGVMTLLTHTLFHSGHDHGVNSVNSIANYPPCPGKPLHSYTFSITAKGIKPSQIEAERCDELTFVNNKSDQASPAFGPHVNHYDYPGFNEEDLAPKQTNSLRLYQAGTFPVHDHYDEGLRATITIKN